MSYLDRTQDPQRRTTAIVAVVAIHALLGYVLVTGFGAKIVETVLQRKPIIDFPLPDPPPPPPERVEDTPPERAPVTAPKPPIEIPRPPVIEPLPYDPSRDLPPIVDRLPPRDPPAPRASPTATMAPKAAVPKNDPAGWVLTDDYPSRAIREEMEGATHFRVVIGSSGRVSACEVTRSSGHPVLDEATCKFVTRRARFEPATDRNGTKVVGSYSSSVLWRLPR